MHAYASRGRGRPPGVRPDRTLNYNTITLLSAGVHICAGWLNIEKSFPTRLLVSTSRRDRVDLAVNFIDQLYDL